eukprot:2494590-Prymnesium_polylepis.1
MGMCMCVFMWPALVAPPPLEVGTPSPEAAVAATPAPADPDLPPPEARAPSAGPAGRSTCGRLRGGRPVPGTGGHLHVVDGCRLLHARVLFAGLTGRQHRRPAAAAPATGVIPAGRRRLRPTLARL